MIKCTYASYILVYFTSYSSKSNFMVRVIIYIPLYSNYTTIVNYASMYYCMYIGMLYLP